MHITFLSPRGHTKGHAEEDLKETSGGWGVRTTDGAYCLASELFRDLVFYRIQVEVKPHFAQPSSRLCLTKACRGRLPSGYL